MERFKKLGIGEQLMKVITEMKFEVPSEIQEKAIPSVLSGKDVIGKAATGSGKTLAFGAGIIQNTKKGEGIQALVLTPTRELAEQVAQALRRFSKHYNLRIQEVYGGVSINGQIDGLRNAEVVVGTPGRILDHLERRTLNLQKVKVLVLDEADRMVDMGFLPDVEKIINMCPKERQNLLFSATISSDIEYIKKKYMKNPQYILVESYIDASKLKQIYYDVPSHMKFSLLAFLLKNETVKKVMIFCNTRTNADIISDNLVRFGLRAVAIHGGLTQNKRNMIISKFHSGEINILVCTDVAARGLDINDVSHIYNYDIPKTSNEYIHRIGRTARAGKEGEAISLVTNRDYDSFRKVLQDESLKIEPWELPRMEQIALYLPQRGRGGGNRRFGERDDSRGRRDFGRRGGGSRGSQWGRGSRGRR